ncbi:ATP-dependent DNA helicase [Catellatospora chokoriensis]|uniref:DNA 3'-5' helicase n=2 Tax=Catellatospora chokoriensis TaxID=310353 RepID=A0A8J3JTX3_9ACTN|nr:DNA helicase [Catellatospora chokoriensis]
MFGVSSGVQRDWRLVRGSGPDRPSLRADAAQQRVIAHESGPLLVRGGPGTGKTTTLVEAVARRVADGVDPQRILVLTFGRRGSQSLRRRIEARIARGVGHEPLVRTFPAYAFGLLRRSAALLGDPSPRLLSGPEQDLVIRELLPGEDAGWPDRLLPALGTRAFAEQLRDLLLRAAERGIGPADPLWQRRDDWQAAARFLHEYEQTMALRDASTRGSAGYDHAELVRAATAMLRRDPELLAAERSRLSAVYVDELADTDPAQVELLQLIAGGLPLTAFADPDSSTYAFRGADPQIVRTFSELFPGTEQVVLATTHRAAPAVRTATARIARRLPGHLPVVPAPRQEQTASFADGTRPAAATDGAALPTAVTSGSAQSSTPAGDAGAGGRSAPPDDPDVGVEVVALRSRVSEAAFVAHRLRRAHLVDGVPFSRMAVIMRSTNSQLPAYERALRQAGVPTKVLAEDLPLHQQPAVKPLLILLRCALKPELLTEDAAVALLHSPLGGADPMAERRLRQGLRALAISGGDTRASGELLVEALRDPAELAALDRRWAAPATRIAMLLATARETAGRPRATAEEVLWSVWRASGLAERWAAVATAPAMGLDQQRRAETADRDLDAIMVLFDAAARFTDRLPGARIDTFLEHVADQQLPADSLAASGDRGEAVRLLTAHAAKGLEWDVVVVAGVQEGVWPDLRLRGSLLGSEQLVDEVSQRAQPGAKAQRVAQTAALLTEERRLFYVAATRARRRLVVTAVDSGAVGGADGEDRPSRFLFELAPPVKVDEDEVAELELARPPRALTLSALVAELRSAVTGPDPVRRHAAARELARLAAAGVPGAHPDSWWGLPELSDDGPLHGPDEPVRVTPSTMESALRCGLRWLLERHGGAAASTAAQGVGNLVHAAAMLADEAMSDPAVLVDYVAARFDAIELAAAWLAGREKDRSAEMLGKLTRWLAENPRRLVAIEREFTVRLAAEPPIDLVGRVDRLEVDDQGRLVVIDLKTGKTTTATREELPEHPQLGAYQVAVEAGGFPEGDESGGAALVQLGTTHRDAKEQVQDAIGETADPQWAHAMVHRTAATMAASTFVAKVNDKCRVCPVKSSCPVSGKGRQVVEP